MIPKTIITVVALIIMIAVIALLSATGTNRETSLLPHAKRGNTQSAGNSTPPLDTVRLPPPDTPLAQSWDALHAAAASGSGPAACRLAMEYVRCRQYAYDRQALEQVKQMPADLLKKPELLKMIAAAVAEVRTRFSANHAVCADFPLDRDTPWRLLLAASLRGHVPSMARFASGSAIADAKGRGEWDLEALGAYREFALRFLERAAQEGDAASIERLGTEHMAPGIGTRAIPFDPPRGLAYLKALAARAAPDYRKELEAKMQQQAEAAHMTPIDIAAAETMSATILPPAALARADAPRPEFKPENDFGCR